MKKTSTAALGLVLIGLLMIGLGATSAGATKPPDHKITICHATDSYSNPYRVIKVDVASTKFAGHEGHLGPIFYPTIPKHTKWGDIIPPTSNDGTKNVTPRNWPAGQSILENGCKLPSPTTTTTAPTTTSTTQPCDCETTTTQSTTTTTTVPETTTTTVPEETTTTTIPQETTTTVIIEPTTTTTVKPATTLGTPRRLTRPPGTGSTTTTPIVVDVGGPLPRTGSPTGLLFVTGSGILGLGLSLVRRFRPLTRG